MGMAGKAVKRIRASFRNFIWKSAARKFRAMRPYYAGEAFRYLIENNMVKEGETPESLAAAWERHVKELFDPSKPEEFYGKWTGAAGASNLIANINDQFARNHIMYALLKYAHFPRGGRLLDFGCGTAVLSMQLMRRHPALVMLTLADVPNMAKDFTAYMAGKYPQYRMKFDDIGLAGEPDGTYDAVLCVHVLEHLKNPSEVFALLDRKLKKGGIIILEAPWGGHPEHLPEAPVDWEYKGGKKMLQENYEEAEHLDLYHEVSGVYRKIK